MGRLDEGFVERLHSGDIFILGSSSWRVLRFQKNRVIVEDVYGLASTIPFWGGDRDSRTYDLGVLVGRFRREMQEHIANADPTGWLQDAYYVGENGARAIYDYLREQQLVTDELPSDVLVLVERFRDELGLQQIVIHSSFGIRVNDPWAMALARVIAENYGFRPQTATVDDGILITIPKEVQLDVEAQRAVAQLVTPENLDELLLRAVLDSPIFVSRFRHNAVRSLMVLREYRGRKTPVWLQSMRASALLEACRDDPDFPLIVETFRECMHESLDVPNLRQVVRGLASGEIAVKTVEIKIPSPFTHSLLLLGQYGDMGSIPTRERRSRLMHLHRELLRQILDEETLRNLLDEAAVEEVDARLQRTDPLRKARNANELARALVDLGDLVDHPDDEISLLDRVAGDVWGMLSELVSTHRAILVPIPTAEMNHERWISTENFPLYRAAFGMPVQLDDVDEQILQALAQDGPLSDAQLSFDRDTEGRLEKLANGYRVLRLPRGGEAEYVAAEAWIPDHILEDSVSREDARLALIRKYLRGHGPVTRYEIMERYGFPGALVERALETLYERGAIARGEYVPTKSFPQWCYKGNLEQIHRLTLNRLRKEMEPATGEEYTDFLIRWQHLYPESRLAGLDGLRKVLGQIQGQENYQIVYERDVFPGRVVDYGPSMLDRLCYGGEVFWRRFGYKRIKRGQIGFCFRRDRDWVVADPNRVEMELSRWDDDIPEACDAVRDYLRENGACFFDNVVEGTGLDWRLVLRAVWHLVWTGEATNDSFESIRHARVASGLSACYDLATKPGRKGVTLDLIVRHILENRALDPRLGRWAPTERLRPSSMGQVEHEGSVLSWAHQLLQRYGVVSRESLKQEAGAPAWKGLRRALIKLELLGKVRRGFFVEGLSGEQYAYPEAVDALRRAKLRHADAENGSARSIVDEPMLLLNACDPANPFGPFFPLTNAVGDEVKPQVRTPQKYLVLQGGQPILLYEGRVRVLVDLTRERTEKALRALMQLVDQPAPVAGHREIQIRSWNGHPTDVSPARHLLLRLGFVQVDNRWRGFVYDGKHVPDTRVMAEAKEHVPDVFEHVGKEKAPVEYDAEWIISRSEEAIRPKVRELIAFLARVLPPGCELVYNPRDFVVRYRGLKCMNPCIQRKQIWLQITHKGWVRGVQIAPETDLDAPEFRGEVLARFEKTRQAIDALLDAKRH